MGLLGSAPVFEWPQNPGDPYWAPWFGRAHRIQRQSLLPAPPPPRPGPLLRLPSLHPVPPILAFPPPSPTLKTHHVSRWRPLCPHLSIDFPVLSHSAGGPPLRRAVRCLRALLAREPFGVGLECLLSVTFISEFLYMP